MRGSDNLRRSDKMNMIKSIKRKFIKRIIDFYDYQILSLSMEMSYNKKCSKCYLLITVPDSYNGNYCFFDNELIKHRFNSEFEKIFLYCVGSDTSYILK